MTPSRPYLIRALYEWITDNGWTPYLLVDARAKGVMVPSEHVENGKIILNIDSQAVYDLDLGNEAICFSARFGGKSIDIVVPVKGALAIYSKENGQGMVFSEEDWDPEPPTNGKKSPHLKLVE